MNTEDNILKDKLLNERILAQGSPLPEEEIQQYQEHGTTIKTEALWMIEKCSPLAAIYSVIWAVNEASESGRFEGEPDDAVVIQKYRDWLHEFSNALYDLTVEWKEKKLKMIQEIKDYAPSSDKPSG